MKNKLVSIIIVTLLIVTLAPTVKPIQNNTITSTIPLTPMTNTAENWTETFKILASDAASGDYFGGSVSIDDKTVIIGARFDDDEGSNSGSAYIFIKNNDVWTQQAKLVASDGTTEDQFGTSVSISGDTALIGAKYDDDKGTNSGSVYIFTRSGTTWNEEAKLVAPDGAPEDQFGSSTAIDGNIALIGAAWDDDLGSSSGSAYVFTRSGSSWTQQAKLLPSNGTKDDRFGWSVSIDGDIALIGTPWDDDKGSDSGSVYAFSRTGNTWNQQTKLVASDGAAGDNFGISISLSGDTSLIGAAWDDDKGTDSGSAYVFTRVGTTWTQQAKLLAVDGAAGDSFGVSVSVYENTAIIGAYKDDDKGIDSGSAYAFSRSGNTWTQQTKLIASNAATEDFFGMSVTLSGNTAVIGAPQAGDTGTGATYVFTRSGAIMFSSPVFALIETLFERFPHAFPILRLIFKH